MDTVLVSSGYRPETLAALREQFHVVDIPDHATALNHLRTISPLPLAVAIGYATPPDMETIATNRLVAKSMLQGVLQIDSELPVVISTHERRPAAIVDLVKRGAFDYVFEPPMPEGIADPVDLERYNQELIVALRRATQWRHKVVENRELRERLINQRVDTPIRARSPRMLAVLNLVNKVAPTPATVLITGETGTGKELIAAAIHNLSPHHSEPFQAINCGALSDTLLNSELFGHVKGAFTGAHADRPGLIRETGLGTLFLDEIAAVTPSFQVTLLRLLEQRVIRPVGGSGQYSARCRFIAAANRDLAELVREGAFREDLYYRLNVFHISIPPLRRRPEDIPVLAHFFLQQAASEFGKEVVGFEAEALELLEQYAWPGNVRQLRNVVDRAAILCDGRLIRAADLRDILEPDHLSHVMPVFHSHQQAMEQFEAELMRQAIQRAGGNLTKAAKLLQMKRTTFHYRMKRLAEAGFSGLAE